VPGGLLILLVVAFVVAAERARGVEVCFPPAGFIRSIQGQVDLKRAGGEWRPAALDDPLCPGDLIRVGERSRALTVFANMVQRIDQNTTLSLTRVAKDERSLIELITGAVYFFSRKPRVLAVDTPYVNAAVEGTEFLVQVEPGRTTIILFQGTLVARNDYGELTLTDGQALVAEAGAAPRREIVIRPRDAVTWALYYPFILPALADRSGAAAEALPEPLGGAVALAARGETAAAFARFEAIPEAERGVDFYLYRAATLLSVGRVDDASADIDRALALDPDASLAYALRAVIALARNEREAGLDDARRAVALAPRSAAVKIALSYAEQAHFRIREARDVLGEAVEDEPGNALAWARLSEVWLMLGDRRRSRDAAERAEELAPELERVRRCAASPPSPPSTRGGRRRRSSGRSASTRRARCRGSASASPGFARAISKRGVRTSSLPSASTPTTRCCAPISARPTSTSGPPTL
jgi:tetratricopeptide (TPR) repeat protein